MDNITKLNKNLKNVYKKFNELKESGIDEEIMIAYLKMKTHFSRKEIKKFLTEQDDFYKKLVSKIVLKKI